MTSEEKNFMLEYEKLCRQWGLCLDSHTGIRLKKLKADMLLSWETWENPTSKTIHVDDILFDPSVEDCECYIQDGKVKQYREEGESGYDYEKSGADQLMSAREVRRKALRFSGNKR